MAGKRQFAGGYNLFALLAFSLTFILGCGGGGGSSSGGNSGGGGVSSGSDGMLLLGWDSNTEYDLAGYRIYYGTSSGAYEQSIDVGMGIQGGDLAIYSLTNLIRGQIYCIAVTAYDIFNNESALSDEVIGDAG